MVRQLYRSAAGRLESSSEAPLLEALTERFVASGYRFRVLLIELVMSPLFRELGALNDEIAPTPELEEEAEGEEESP